ncbi:MAG: hypothetical protein ACXAEU_01255 [Candidatus Hodarchaeales archaeon]|jgi:hypothetical protein
MSTRIELTGSIRRYDVDPVLKLQRIDLFEPNKKFTFYIEVPLKVVNLEGVDSFKIKLEPEEGQEIDFNKVKLVLNTDLYSVRTTENEYKYFFSAGGIQFRIYSNEPLGFSMRDQRHYKIILK